MWQIVLSDVYFRLMCFIYLFIYTTTHCSLLRLIVRYGLDVPTFTTRRLHARHHARAPSGGRWNCEREMSGKLCLNVDFQVTFRDRLHAVKLRHGTDGFTSPPKEGVLRIRLMCQTVSVFISVLATLLSGKPRGIS
jgi:hypothetical protein